MADEELPDVERREIGQQHVDKVAVGMRAGAQRIEIGRMLGGDARPGAAGLDPAQKLGEAEEFLGQRLAELPREAVQVAPPHPREVGSEPVGGVDQHEIHLLPQDRRRHIFQPCRRPGKPRDGCNARTT